jgi:plastocyanin
MRLIRFLYFIFSGWLLIAAQNSAQSATLALEFIDDAGKPVTGVVAALIPENNPGYTEKAKAVMDQQHKMFVPSVLAVRVNTLVQFPNSDNIRHQVYSFSPAKRFELRLYHGMTAEPVLFDQAGQVVLGCNIHDSMVGYIYVVDSEYFSVSDGSGSANIATVPVGKYTLQIQHPKLAKPYPEQKLIFTAEQTITQKIKLTGFIEDKKDDPDSLDSLFK